MNADAIRRWFDAVTALSARKQRKTGKRVSLKDRYVFSIQELLDIAREAELQTSNKKVHRPRHMLQSGKLDSEDEEVIENRSSDDESDSLVLASLRPFRT